MSKLRLAIFSPGVDVYSETFILNHKQKLSGKVFFYYDGSIPTRLDEAVAPRDIVLSKKELSIAQGYNDAEKMYQLKASLKQNKIDVVMCEYGTTAAASLPVIKTLGLPLIVHFHGYDAYEYDVIEKWGNQYKEVFDYASTVVAVSEAMRKQLISLGCPDVKIICAPCGARDIFFDLKPIQKSHQFLSVGRFVPKKAPHMTVLAFNEVVRQYPHARLMMFGDGPLYDVCRRIVKYCGLEDKVTLPGAVSSDTVLKEMEKSTALVQHSVVALNGDSEGTPVAVLEAGAAGIPVVATKHAGIAEVVIDGKTGWLVEEYDVMGMARAMAKVISDNKASRKMGETARRNIRDNFTDIASIQKLNLAVRTGYEQHARKPSKIDYISRRLQGDSVYRYSVAIRESEAIIKENRQLSEQLAMLKRSYRWRIGDKIVSSVSWTQNLARNLTGRLR